MTPFAYPRPLHTMNSGESFTSGSNYIPLTEVSGDKGLSEAVRLLWLLKKYVITPSGALQINQIIPPPTVTTDYSFSGNITVPDGGPYSNETGPAFLYSFLGNPQASAFPLPLGEPISRIKAVQPYIGSFRSVVWPSGIPANQQFRQAIFYIQKVSGIFYLNARITYYLGFSGFAAIVNTNTDTDFTGYMNLGNFNVDVFGYNVPCKAMLFTGGNYSNSFTGYGMTVTSESYT